MYLAMVALPLLTAIVGGVAGRKLGREGVAVYTVVMMGTTAAMGGAIMNEVVMHKVHTYVKLWRWVMVDSGLQYDGMTGIMLVVVTSISMLVHIYSTEYMSEDPHQGRFMVYLTMFTWFMIILVTADNLMQLFVGWEGVGLCSYLLINYWWTRIQANKAAMKAMIVNRVGDVGVVLAIVICSSTYGSVEYAVILAQEAGPETQMIGMLILIGAMGKSAQLGLHVWLPDAMEGPTPVSALIHAATMVTAGVFVLIRMSPLIARADTVMTAIAIVGGATAFYAATVGLVQNDIKKVIAYSTCSQLGYMVLACGIGASTASIYHLYNHAFFKALLFLSAGSVIHAIGDEQDIRKMGGQIGRQPQTYSVMVIGSMSLMGIPFLTGFYSKDAIIEMAYGSYTIAGTMGHWLGSLTAMMTAFYTVRQMNIAYYQEPEADKRAYERASEPTLAMSIPLLVLGGASIYMGYVMKDVMIGPGSPYLELEGGNAHHPAESENIETWVKLIPVVLSLAGAGFGMGIYPKTARGMDKKLYTFLNDKWHFDKIYNEEIVGRVMRLGHEVTYKVLDRGQIEKIGPTGIVGGIVRMARAMSGIQSGELNHYSMTMIVGTIVLMVLKAQ